MTIFENLSELKTQLFDASPEVKAAFNKVARHIKETKCKSITKEDLEVAKKYLRELRSNLPPTAADYKKPVTDEQARDYLLVTSEFH